MSGQIKDVSERLVSEYLAHHAMAFVHHPNGENDPPDFSVDGRIGIEVRRLNQNVDTPDGPRGIEGDAISIRNLIEKTLSATGSPGDGRCWYVWYHIRRPIPSQKDLVKELRNVLKDVQSESGADVDVRWIGNIRLRFYRSPAPLEHVFEFGGCGDSDSGGFLVSEMQRNTQICIDEKTKKIERVRDRYPEWWLTLVDRISFGMSDKNRDSLRGLITSKGPWNRVIIINCQDPQDWFEL